MCHLAAIYVAVWGILDHHAISLSVTSILSFFLLHLHWSRAVHDESLGLVSFLSLAKKESTKQPCHQDHDWKSE